MCSQIILALKLVPLFENIFVNLDIFVIVNLDFDNMTEIKVLKLYWTMIICFFYELSIIIITCATKQRHDRQRIIQREISSTSTRRRKQHEYLHRIVFESDIKCIDKLRMDQCCFHNLCQLLATTHGTIYTSIQVMTAMFLNIIAHNVKNRIIKYDFVRFAEIVS